MNRAHKLTNDRREAHVCNFMCKCKSNTALLNRREIRTRAHDVPLFLVPILRCEALRRNVCFHGSNSWNGLSADVRNIGNYPAFKLNRKTVMLQPLKLIQL